MSYRLEKEPNGVQAIVIDGWEKGIASDPYSGLGKVLTADLSTSGEIACGYSLTSNVLGTGTVNTPIHRAMKETTGVAQIYFILDSASQVWSSTTYNGTFSFLSSSNSTTGATATNQGLIYWIPPSGGNGWLFKFRNDSIDYMAGGSGSWTTGWKPSDGSSGATGVIRANTNHYAIVSQSGTVFFCNGAGVGQFLEAPNQTFDPTNPATYIFNAAPNTTYDATALPTYDTAQSLAMQGGSLLIGGSLNVIYSWDTLTPNFYDNYIFIGDTFIDRMVTVNTNVYIFAGGTMSRGRIYVCNGSNANLFYKIPDYITGEQDPYFIWGDAMFHRNNLVFGFFMKKNGGGFITADNTFRSTGMVWAVDLSVNIYGTPTESNFRSLSAMAAGTTQLRASVLLPALQTSPGFSYIVGVDDAQGSTSAAIQYSGTTVGIGSYTVYTDLIPVGTLFERRTFTQVEFKLRTGLASGESLDILPIVDGIVGASMGVANTVGQISAVNTVNFEKAQWLQFLVHGIGNNALSGVRLKEIRIR